MADPRSNLDELMKDPEAAGLLKNKVLLQSLMQSSDTQRLAELLSQNAGDGLKTAAAEGDTDVLLSMVWQVMQSSEGAQLVQNISQTMPKEKKQIFRREEAGDMAESEEKLNAILNGPQAMGQIASLAQALTRKHAEGSTPPPVAEPAEAEPAREAVGQSDAADWSALLDMLGGGGDNNPPSALSELDPQLLQTGLCLFSEYSVTDDREAALLNVLKPFVKPEQYTKVDKAAQIAKLARVIRVAFQLFWSRQEEGKDDV